MPDSNSLIRLPFATVGSAVHFPRFVAAYTDEAVPKLRRGRAIVGVAQRFSQFAVFNELETYSVDRRLTKTDLPPCKRHVQCHQLTQRTNRCRVLS